ncbi:hypothetical protein RvY_05603 [Ramazzottius varieornatus]|uniref:Serine aminopeptidase S33 domain-containing protein n=1 Tax=Ramazzottius varieornatus TaxID=947166 RepID=A0A1D1V2A3_RAMVA|nr:hypothetical protein RvY_05603 [Ramazzottius varieornatus]
MDLIDGRIFAGSQGVDIYCRYWEPQLPPGKQPTGLVFVAHGLFEYCGMSITLMDALTRAAYFVLGHDHCESTVLRNVVPENGQILRT